MTKEQETLYNMYMKLSKKELAEMLAIINTKNNVYPITQPLQDGVYPQYEVPIKLPPYRPIEVWYTTKTNEPEYSGLNESNTTGVSFSLN